MVAIARRAALLTLSLLMAACGDASSKAETAKSSDAVKNAVESGIDANDMVMGNKDAAVTIVEYASITCPHCATFHSEVLPGIKEKYIDTGKAKLVFREFPTPPQLLSVVGSMVARCAAEKGGSDAYFLVIGTLFKTQQTWIGGADPKLELQKVATQAGMDTAAFDACLQRQDLLDMMNGRIKEAQDKHKVDSTPTFFIDGEQAPSRADADQFGKMIDEALAKSKS